MTLFGQGTRAVFGIAALSVMLMLAVNVPVGAVVTFNDGAAHDIPGTDANIFDTDGGVGANVLDGGGSTSLTVSPGGTIDVDDTANNGANAIAVQVRNTSFFTFAGGTVFAENTAGGQGPIGVEAFNNATVTISGPGTIGSLDSSGAGGSARGILARNSSIIDVQAGTEVQASDTGNGHAFAIQAVNTPTINVDGGLLAVDSGGNSARAIQLNNGAGANVTVGSSGMLNVIENGGGDAFGIFAAGGGNSSTIDFFGSINIDENGGGTAQGIRTDGTSVANVHVGSSISIDSESGGDNALGVLATGNSTINVAGSISILEENGGSVRTVVANNNSTVNILTGFSHDTSQQGGGGDNRAVIVNNDGTVNIFGGDLDNQATMGGGVFDGLLVNGNGTLNIHALGGPVMLDGNLLTTGPGNKITLTSADTTGFDSFSLTLRDGTVLTNPLNIAGAGATVNIFFVPEPTTACLGLLGIAAMACRRRHRNNVA